MESLENSDDSLGLVRLPISDDELSMENDSIELENSKNLHSYENKEYSSEDNPKNVENHSHIVN